MPKVLFKDPKIKEGNQSFGLFGCTWQWFVLPNVIPHPAPKENVKIRLNMILYHEKPDNADPLRTWLIFRWGANWMAGYQTLAAFELPPMKTPPQFATAVGMDQLTGFYWNRENRPVTNGPVNLQNILNLHNENEQHDKWEAMWAMNVNMKGVLKLKLVVSHPINAKWIKQTKCRLDLSAAQWANVYQNGQTYHNTGVRFVNQNDWNSLFPSPESKCGVAKDATGKFWQEMHQKGAKWSIAASKSGEDDKCTKGKGSKFPSRERQMQFDVASPSVCPDGFWHCGRYATDLKKWEGEVPNCMGWP